MPSRLSTVRRFVHAEISGSGFILLFFVFVAVRARVSVAGFVVPRFLVLGRLLFGFVPGSSSAESADSTRRGITSLTDSTSIDRSWRLLDAGN